MRHHRQRLDSNLSMVDATHLRNLPVLDELLPVSTIRLQQASNQLERHRPSITVVRPFALPSVLQTALREYTQPWWQRCVDR